MRTEDVTHKAVCEFASLDMLEPNLKWRLNEAGLARMPRPLLDELSDCSVALFVADTFHYLRTRKEMTDKANSGEFIGQMANILRRMCRHHHNLVKQVAETWRVGPMVVWVALAVRVVEIAEGLDLLCWTSKSELHQQRSAVDV